MSLPLSNKTAIVTGSSSGIGRAIAEKFGAAGAHVYLSGRTREAMEESKKRIEQGPGRATVVTADLRDVRPAAFGDVLAGRHPGRSGSAELTVYAPVGLPWQDLAAAWITGQEIGRASWRERV